MARNEGNSSPKSLSPSSSSITSEDLVVLLECVVLSDDIVRIIVSYSEERRTAALVCRTWMKAVASVVRKDCAIMVLGGKSGSAPQHRPLIFSTLTNAWRTAAAPPRYLEYEYSRQYIYRSFVRLGGYFYAIGRKRSERIMARYDPLDEVWIELPPPLHGDDLMVFKNRLCVFNLFRRDRMDIFNPAKGQWEEQGTARRQHLSFNIAVFRGSFYLLTTRLKSNRNTSVVQRWHPGTDHDQREWLTVSGMQCPRYELSLESVGEAIYSLGHLYYNDSSGQIGEKYCPATDEWTAMEPLKSRRGFSTAVVAEAIYVIGGWSGTDETSDVNVYDTVTGRWSKGPPLPNPLCYHLSA